MNTQTAITLEQAHSRLRNKPASPVTVTMQTGDGEPQSTTIYVPNEALNAGHLGFDVEDFVKDTLKVRVIQVWVECYVNDVKTIETLFVPLLGWHMLSVNWDLIIEEYVSEKLFDSDENQSAPPEKKRTGSYCISYRRNGESGPLSRKERFQEWWTGLTGRGQTILFRRWRTDWSIPMPPVSPPREKVAAA